MMKEFSCKTRIVMGCPAAQVLKERNFDKIMVVSDPFFARNGMAQSLGQQAREFAIFDKVAPDPSVELVAQGVSLLQQFDPDGLVALGGGSAMDCAKAMRFFSGKNIPFLAVPTTSGSGSEVTDFAILTHNAVKHPLVDEKLRPDVAVLDENMVSSLPSGLIADGGFDVLTHALEAWVGQNANPVTDALALDAFRTVYTKLHASFLGDKKVRLSIHAASTMAGLAFTQAGLGVCHALAHALGGQFHVPHGRLNGILLPAVIAHNGAASRYAQLSRALGLGGSGDQMAVRSIKNGLMRLRKQLGLPATLAEAGVENGALRQKMPELIRAALSDPCCVTNPVPVTESLLRQILQEVSGIG